MLVGDRCMLSKLVEMENLIISKLDWLPKSIPNIWSKWRKVLVADGCMLSKLVQMEKSIVSELDPKSTVQMGKIDG